MSTDLIPFGTRQLQQGTVNTVNARDIHAFLELKKEYSSWIRQSIARAGLQENTDFVVSSLQGDNPKGGRPASEHHLTFDAAKHVAMMSNAQKGRKVREYFIAKEKELAALTPATHGDLLVQMAEAYRLQERRLLEVEASQQDQQRQFMEQQATIIASQAQAIEALQLAQGADTKADMALDTNAFHTVAEHVCFEQLTTQIPASDYRALSDHMRLYCLDKGRPFRRVSIGGKAWPEEYAYHTSTYAEALPGWLQRRYAQTSLRVIHPTQDAR